MDERVGALAGLHVLVVEDNRDARVIFSQVLTYFGALVTTVSTAAEAARHLRAMRPDVVLADVQLPDRDAPVLLRQMRRRGVAVPFIAISGGDLDERELLAAGFDIFLRKPIDHARLIDAVLAVTRR